MGRPLGSKNKKKAKKKTITKRARKTRAVKTKKVKGPTIRELAAIKREEKKRDKAFKEAEKVRIKNEKIAAREAKKIKPKRITKKMLKEQERAHKLQLKAERLAEKEAKKQERLHKKTKSERNKKRKEYEIGLEEIQGRLNMATVAYMNMSLIKGSKEWKRAKEKMMVIVEEKKEYINTHGGSHIASHKIINDDNMQEALQLAKEKRKAKRDAKKKGHTLHV